MRSREESTSEAVSPREEVERVMRGWRVDSATDSAVRVFPTPGSPVSRRMNPCPLPGMMSSKLSECKSCSCTKARIMVL